MKGYPMVILTVLTSISINYIQAQNVGIAISTPTEKFHVDSGNIKIGQSIWTPDKSHLLKFGDSDYVSIGELGNDSMQIKAWYISLVPPYGVNTKLDISGNIKVSDGSQGVGKVLTSDSSGLATWKQPVYVNSGFKATNSTNLTIASGAIVSPSFNVEDYDDGSVYSSGVFTAPATGLYHFNTTIVWDLATTLVSSDFSFWISSSGGTSHFDVMRLSTGSSGTRTQSINCDMKLTAGQTVQINYSQNSGVTQSIYGNFSNNKFSYFSGHRVY